VGNKVGDIIKTVFTDTFKQMLDALNPEKNPNVFSLNPLDWFKQAPKTLTKPDMSNAFDRSYQDELNGRTPGSGSGPNISLTGSSITLPPGAPNGLVQELQQMMDKKDQEVLNQVTDLIKRYYGG
jgi:hypothetical protein